MTSLIFDRIQAREYERLEYFPRSTDVTLNDFETQFGVVLPDSYREFCQRFGPGELAGFYCIAAPIGIQDTYNLLQYNAERRESIANGAYDSYGSREMAQHFLFFCDGGGEPFIWKLDESTNADANEYAIYCLRRNNKLKKVATSFEGFVDSVISKKGTKPVFARFQRT